MKSSAPKRSAGSSPSRGSFERGFGGSWSQSASCRQLRRSVGGSPDERRSTLIFVPMELTPPPLSRRYHPLIEGFRVNWQTLLLIAAINTGIALVLWIDDPRPFWHPFVTVQLNGFSIAYCVNVAAPWDKPRPIIRLALACFIGALLGLVLVVVAKRYSLEYVRGHHWFTWDLFAAFINGLLVSLIFFVKF